MSDSTQPPAEAKEEIKSHESLADKILHPHHHHEHQTKDSSKSADVSTEHHKESEIDKVKDYVKEDQKLEEEGKTYGGLM